LTISDVIGFTIVGIRVKAIRIRTTATTMLLNIICAR